jgi:hypothetical protein
MNRRENANTHTASERKGGGGRDREGRNHGRGLDPTHELAKK